MTPRQKHAASGFTLIEVIVTIVIVAVVGAMLTAYFSSSITQSSIPIFRLNAAARLNDVLEKISVRYTQQAHWRPNTTYAAGAVVLPTPTKRTGLLYRTVSGGTSGSSENPISWPLTQGGTVSDGTVTWTTVWSGGVNGAAPALALTAWVAGKAYSQQAPTTPASIVYSGGNQYICTTGGTSGGSAPGFGGCTTSGCTVSGDGTVTWQYVGPAPTVVMQADIGTEGQDYDNTFGRYRVVHNRFITFDKTNNPATEVDLSGTQADPDYGKYLKVTVGMHSGDADRTGETLTTLLVLR
jgi:prepilin-type N-terminal cleavage/methylation domain-containing protein